MVSYTSRSLTAADELIIWTMLMHAAHEPSLEVVQQNPLLIPYVEQWGRSGDLSLFNDSKQKKTLVAT